MSRKTTELLLDGAGRLHLFVLRLAVRILTLFLLAGPVILAWVIHCVRQYHRLEILTGFFRNPEHVLALLLLLLSYCGMFSALFWLCIICRRLRIVRRIFVWSLIWIPGVNYFLAWYVRGLACQEIDHMLYKIHLEDVRAEKNICRTRYPLLLVHGIGFRDFRYFNYWGRIPRELVRNGATVYYGHQEAWGTIEDNAAMLKEKIEEICKERHCDKVNIIAHSKGGLDARYLISGLSMAPHVASLTTINTPHHGSALVEFLKRLPDWLYRSICERIDHYFMAFGDKDPNTYDASWQLSCTYAKEFNEKYPDAEGVYYQSFTSLMKHGFSSFLLCVPYWVLKHLDGPNDGLVTAESARWTNFHEVVTNRHLRGISHADIIDLPREDYRGFRVLEFYVQMVQELAGRGY